jgi:hypothetical protein
MHQKLHWKEEAGQLYLTMMHRPDLLSRLIDSDRLKIEWETTLEILVARVDCIGCAEYAKLPSKEQPDNCERETDLYYDCYLFGCDEEAEEAEEDEELVTILFVRSVTYKSAQRKIIRFDKQRLCEPHMKQYLGSSKATIRFATSHALLDANGFAFAGDVGLAGDEEVISESLWSQERYEALGQLLREHTNILYLFRTIDCDNADAIAYQAEHLASIVWEVCPHPFRYLLWIDLENMIDDGEPTVTQETWTMFRDLFEYHLNGDGGNYFAMDSTMQKPEYNIHRAIAAPHLQGKRMQIKIFVTSTSEVHDER